MVKFIWLGLITIGLFALYAINRLKMERWKKEQLERKQTERERLIANRLKKIVEVMWLYFLASALIAAFAFIAYIAGYIVFVKLLPAFLRM